MRDAGTDFLFAGLLEKELKKHPFPIDVDIWVEPRGKGPIYFSQDGSVESGDGVKFCFYAEPSEQKKMRDMFGKNSAFVTYAADPKIHRQIPSEKIYDVGFIGKSGGDDRDDYLRALRESGLKVFISDSIPGPEVSHALSKCKILFNHIRFVDVNLRFFETMAIGCQVATFNPNLPNLAGETTFFCYDPSSMVDIIKYLLKNPNLISETEIKARNHFLSNHTYAHRAISIINHLKEFYV